MMSISFKKKKEGQGVEARIAPTNLGASFWGATMNILWDPQNGSSGFDGVDTKCSPSSNLIYIYILITKEEG